MERHQDAVSEAARIAAPIFFEQGWEWSRVAGVPDALDIRDAFSRLAESLSDPATSMVRSGRLAVVPERDDETQQLIGVLYFVEVGADH